MNQVVVYYSVSNKGENITSTSHQKLKTAYKIRLKKKMFLLGALTGNISVLPPT